MKDTVATDGIEFVYVQPCWLAASGNPDRLLVSRSTAVAEDRRMFRPVRDFVEEHGLTLASRETVADHRFMRGQVEVSLYTSA